MGLYIISYLAERDLNAIYDYIAEENPAAALQVIIRLEEQFNTISDMPNIGRKREELAASLRSSPQGRYVIFYRDFKDCVEIARVIHSARDIDSIFDV